MCLDSTAIDIQLVIAFVSYRCSVPGFSHLQEHPKGAHCGPEHVVPKRQTVPDITSRWQQRGLQLGHVSSHAWWRTFDVQIFTWGIYIEVWCSVCLGHFFNIIYNILLLNIIAFITLLLLITIIMIILLIILTDVFKLCFVSKLTQSISKHFNTIIPSIITYR